MTVTFASLKGGVGKSVSSILFAEILSAKKKNVLLVDFDPQAACTSFYGEGTYEGDIFDVLTGKEAIEDTINPICDGLDFLPSSILLAQFNDARPIGYETKLKNALAECEHDFIIIDTPPSLGNELINGLTIADIVISPVTPDAWSLEAFEILESKAGDVRKHYNTGMSAPLILQTMCEKRRAVGGAIAEKLTSRNDVITQKISRTSSIQKMIAYRERPKKTENYWTEYSAAVEKAIL